MSSVFSGVYLQGCVENPQVQFGTESSLKAVQDKSCYDVPAGVMHGAELLRGQLDLLGCVSIWTHQQDHSDTDIYRYLRCIQSVISFLLL